MKIKKIILSHKLLYETYFLFSGKKLNKWYYDKKILLLKRKQKKINNYESNLIVSLTSYGERIKDLKYTLYSLINQTIIPEKIIVYLYDKESIPEELDVFKKYGVVFSFYKNDIKSYKKLIPAINEYPDYYIVTADDDIFYKRNWLKKLWKSHLKYPNRKIAHIAHEVSFDVQKELLPYNKWKHRVNSDLAGKNIFPVGAGGILYPPMHISKEFLNESTFMTLAPNADDVWFYFMGLLTGLETIIVPNPYNHLKYVDIYKEYGLNKNRTLQSINVEQNFNDIQIQNVMNYFNIDEKKLYQIINS